MQTTQAHALKASFLKDSLAALCSLLAFIHRFSHYLFIWASGNGCRDTVVGRVRHHACYSTARCVLYAVAHQPTLRARTEHEIRPCSCVQPTLECIRYAPPTQLNVRSSRDHSHTVSCMSVRNTTSQLFFSFRLSSSMHISVLFSFTLLLLFLFVSSPL